MFRINFSLKNFKHQLWLMKVVEFLVLHGGLFALWAMSAPRRALFGFIVGLCFYLYAPISVMLKEKGEKHERHLTYLYSKLVSINYEFSEILYITCWTMVFLVLYKMSHFGAALAGFFFFMVLHDVLLYFFHRFAHRYPAKCPDRNYTDLY